MSLVSPCDALRPGERLSTPALGLALCLLPLVTLVSTRTEAHEVIPGVVGLASAALHPFLATEIVLVMVASALLAASGERWRTLVWCSAATAAGVAIGMGLQVPLLAVPGLWRWPLAVALGLGLAVASGIRFGETARIAMVVVAAVAVGLGTPRERPFLSGAAEAWAGSVLALHVVGVVLAIPLLRFPHPALRIAARAIGSWIAAISALGLAVAFR